MIRHAVIVAAAAVLLGLALLLGAWRLWIGPGPVPDGGQGGGPSTALVRIEPGMTLSSAADSLAAHGLLENPAVLKIGARLTGKGRALRAGLYELSYGSSPRDLLQVVTSGAVVLVKVTIPEGLDAGEIASIVSGALDFGPEDFLAAADSLVVAAAQQGRLLGKGAPEVAALDSLLSAESDRHPRRFRWCEGHLAPDTFHFAEGTDPLRAAQFLVTTQWARLDSVMAATALSGGSVSSRQELLTLASIVEAEARRADERSRIAAVYVNRLRKGWRLEADPTVAFVLRKKGKRLYYRDLEVGSPFNTYRNKGLPPGPIGNPGRAAIQAAAQPDTSCRAMYFVSDGQGGHVFSNTAREHEAAVLEFRRARAGQGASRND